jgi:alcohol dehydrogenase
MQCAALIADVETHQKMACLDPKVLPAISVLDPELTLSQPPRVAACTGLDAVAHAVETAVTTKRNAESLTFSREAFKLCVSALPVVLAAPDNVEARAKMQLGAAFAGAAIERSMLGAAHAAANPLTARFGIVHGHAVGLMLPHVVKFNSELADVQATYAELAAQAGIASPADSITHAAGLMRERLRELLEVAGLPRTLSALGVSRQAIPELAAEAEKQWTAGFNPRSIGVNDFVGLYTAAF